MSMASTSPMDRSTGWLLLIIVLIIQSVILVQSELGINQVYASELPSQFIPNGALNSVFNTRLGCEAKSPPIVVKDVFASVSQAPHVKENTLDRNLNTRWSANGTEQWIYYDLGEIKTLSHVAIAFYEGDQRKARFKLEVSNDPSDQSKWATVLENGLSSGTTLNLEQFDFPNVNARYIRYFGTKNTSEDGDHSLTEFRIYGGVIHPSSLGDPPIVVTQASASASQDPHLPRNTLDSDPNTHWTALSADGNVPSIKYDLGESMVLSHVAIAFHQGDQHKYSFRLEVSEDDSIWTLVRKSGQSSGTTLNLETFEFDVKNVKARYLRYHGEGNTSGNGNNSLTEFRIYRGEVQPPPLAVKQVRASTHEPELARNTLDGDLNTLWSADGKGQWIEYDLGERKQISHVGIIFDKEDQRIAGFNLLAYDDPNDQSTSVTVLANGQSSGMKRDLEIFDFTDVQKRYLRYDGQGNNLDNGNRLTEVRIYGGKISPTQITIEDVKASTPEGSTDPRNTLDNDPNTNWLATGSDQWIYYDLGSQGDKVIDRVEIAFYKGNERKYRFRLEVSDDASKWKPVLKNGQNSGTKLDRETFDFADVKARYLRYLGQGNDINQENGLTIVNVFQGKLMSNLVISSGPPSVSSNTVAPGESVKLSAWTVENCGDVATGDFEYGFYMSRDAMIDINDTSLDGKATNSLEPGVPLSLESLELKIPPSTASGTNYLGILVDRANTADESSEWNNYMSAKITVAASKPDLMVSSAPRLGSSSSVKPGSAITLSGWTVMNTGTGAADPFSYDFYLSIDNAIDSGDIPLPPRHSYSGLPPKRRKLLAVRH